MSARGRADGPGRHPARRRPPAVLLAGVSLAVAVSGVAAAAARPPAALPGTQVTTGTPAITGTPAPAAYVNPRSGSLGAGFSFVGAAVPFGMVTPGPATMLPGQSDPINYVGYGYQDPDIYGFALTHFDGAGIHIAGDLPVMATTGAVTSSNPADFASPFSHATEVAHPGSYAVTLSRYRVRAELTATTRVALLRFTYPAGAAANVLFDTSQNNTGENLAHVTITSDHTLAGSMTATSFGGYTVYFAASFDRAFHSTGTWSGAQLHPGSRSSRSVGTGAWVSFPASAAAQSVTVRIGLSYTGLAGAWANLAAGAPPSRSFTAIAAAATARWNRDLGRVRISGGTLGERRTFYTNLYRALLMPSVFNDANGAYLGLDGRIHHLPAGQVHYTNLSLWDIYRSQMPLLELIDPVVARGVATSLLADYAQERDRFPRWVYANRDYGIMGGDSATPILASELANGVLTGGSARTAYADIVHQESTPHRSAGHLGEYLAKGYLPYAGVSDNRPTSESLSYAIDDAAIAEVAHRYGTPAQVRRFSALAGNWRHLFDPTDRFLRPRLANGAWADPTSVGPVATYTPDSQNGWQEGTGWQYLWSVPQDVAGLAAAIGGRGPTLARLDEFFATALQTDTAALPTAQADASGGGVYYVGNQYTAANEPDLWAPYYYDWLGQPATASKVVHSEMRSYNATPEGLPGNDDAGELSAWYVLSALGIYQVAPGFAVWEVVTPTFPVAALDVGGRAPFVITAPGTSRLRADITSARLDGRAWGRTWIPTSAIRPGGQLAMTLGVRPSPTWGTSPADAPPSLP